MRILLGGVPFGCDNIGDEAILACVIAIFRKLKPDAELMVSTRDQQGTTAKFKLKTIPLYGFDPEYPASDFHQALDGVDLFVWAGATGLSDYPQMGCQLLESARRMGVRSIVWNVGMNDVLNPAFFQIRGKKLLLCKLARKLTGYDLKQALEKRKIEAARRRIGRTLAQCALVVLRDRRSLNELRRCGDFPDAVYGADSALLQAGTDFDALAWSPEDAARFCNAEKRLAICISAQNSILQPHEFCDWLNRLHAARKDVLTVMIPMNLKTDYVLMKNLLPRLECPERVLLTGFAEPEEVQEIVGRCSLVVSSRLHLMILALNRLVPCVGIARGSKIPFFLDEFELPCAGTTEAIDFPALTDAVNHYLDFAEFPAKALDRRNSMLTQLDQAETRLQQVLNSF